MQQSMRACLRLISLLLLFYQLPCLASEVRQKEIVDSITADSLVTDSAVIKQYNLLLQVRDNDISGIFVMRIVSPTEIIGTVVNEFGFTAFDFEYREGKTELSNLTPFLDKWYIRRVLQEDLSFFFVNFLLQQDIKKRSRELLFTSDGEIILTNNRFKIKYVFTPIIDEV